MSGPGVGVESVSSSEWEAIAAMMDCVESTPAAPNQRPSSNFHSFRPASSLPATSAPPSSASPSFAASATSGNRPHASRFQIPTGPSTQVPSPPAHGARGTTASRGERPAPPAAASLTPQPAFGRPPPAASGPQLQFTSSSAPPGPSTSASPYARGAPPTRAPHVPTTTTAPPAKPKPQFENPYQKQQEEKDKSYSFSYTPGTPAAGGRSTFNRFNKNPSIFNATETAPFDDDQPPNGYDGDYDDFQASSLPPQPAQGRGPSSSSSSSGFTYPSPSSTPNAARGGPPQQQHHGNSSQQSAAMRGAGGRPPPAVAFPQPRPPTFYGNAPPVPIDVQLVDRERFGAAEPNKRDKWLSDFYASVPGSTFDAFTKMWTFPLSCYTSFTKAIEDSRGVTLNGPLPPWIMRLFVYKEKKPLNMSVQLDKIPVGLLNALYPFQREGVMFALQRNGRALIADEMGLGKTLQAIAIAAYYKEDWPVLVVAPSSVRVQWADNFEKWIPGLRPDQIKVIMKTKDNPDGLVNIISYDLVVRQTNIAQKKFRVIIADESHTIKSWKAKRTSHLQPLLKDARRCILLTGTPALSRPEELFTQLHALDSQVFVRMTDFGVRYCAGHQTRFCWDYSGSSNLKELNLLLQETVMIRRLKCDVLGQLPAKKRMQVFLGIIDKHKKIIGNINDKIKEHKKMFHIAHSTDAAKSARFEAWRLIKELYHNTGTAKLPAVTEYIKEMLKTKNKIIVFAYHHDVMDGIGLLLEREGVEYVRIDGMTPPQHRQELVDYYQNQPNCRAAVLGLTSAGVGLTMTKAEAVIMTELYWNPGILRQAEDRAHRIGVEHEVEVFYLVARGTLDESIWEMIRHKLDVLGNTLNGEQEVLEAEEVEGKAPDGSTIDVFMEKILQKVETFEEREKAYQERRQQQQRDAEMMNQIIREDQQQAARLVEEAAPEPGVGFQPATIYFDAADSTLEAVDEELDEVMARVKGKTGRGVTLGRGGKVTKPPTPAASKRKGTTAAKQHGTSAKRKLDEVEEDEEEPPLADDGVWADDDDDFEDEPAPATLPPWSAKRAPSVDERSYDNGDDDDFVSTPYGGSKISLRATPSSSSSSSRTRRTSAAASSSSSASASSTPAGAPRKRPRVVLDDEDADEDDFAAPTTAPAAFVHHEGMEEEEAEPYHDRAGAFEEEGDHDTPTTNARAAAQTSQPRGPRQLPGSFARPLGSSSTAAAPDGGGPMPRAGQLGRFSFAGGRRLANRD